jgi:hypothetical protein
VRWRIDPAAPARLYMVQLKDRARNQDADHDQLTHHRRATDPSLLEVG